MTDLYRHPVSYGIRDITFAPPRPRPRPLPPIPAKGIENAPPVAFRARIYFPSDEPESGAAPSRHQRFVAAIRRGTYPLIVFLHGEADPSVLVPPEGLHAAWELLHRLWARCGFVVLSPDIGGASDVDSTADVIRSAVRWITQTWEHADVFPPLRMAFVGHSWGAGHAANAIASFRYPASAFVGISPTMETLVWPVEERTRLIAPSLLVSGTQDNAVSSIPAQVPYGELRTPKYQVAFQGTRHWDYFGAAGGVQPRDGHPAGWCSATGYVTREIVLNFLAKHVLGMSYLGPYLLTAPAGRPPVSQYFDAGAACAIKIRWNEPGSTSPLGAVGEVGLGNWTEASPW